MLHNGGFIDNPIQDRERRQTHILVRTKEVEVGLIINTVASFISLIISCRYPTNKFHLIVRGFAPTKKRG